MNKLEDLEDPEDLGDLGDRESLKEKREGPPGEKYYLLNSLTILTEERKN